MALQIKSVTLCHQATLYSVLPNLIKALAAVIFAINDDDVWNQHTSLWLKQLPLEV